RMYQDKLASLKRQLQQLQEGTLQEYQKRMKKLDQQYKERIRNAGKLFIFQSSESSCSLPAVPTWMLEAIMRKSHFLCERSSHFPCALCRKFLIFTPLPVVLSALQLCFSADSMEVKPIMTRKLRRRPNDPVPIPDKRRKPAPDILLQNHWRLLYLKLACCLQCTSPSSPEHLPATPAESPAQRFEARIEDGKLYYDKRWYHKSQAIYLESKENTKISCVISSVGANEIWVRKTSDSTKMRIYLGQLQRGVFVIRRRSAA
ncbi:SDS3 deacetylase, partial [Odontophorus gujanensis]|nr:SDS3 deacetylase [Odontophorus gujanensis]